MPYIDNDYYETDYKGKPFEDDQFERCAQRASELIDQLTHYRITDFDNMHDFVKSQIKKATAAQVEHYQLSGGYDAVMGSDDLGKVSIGSFSYGSSSSSNDDNKVATASRNAFEYLKPTGLLYGGIGVVNGY